MDQDWLARRRAARLAAATERARVRSEAPPKIPGWLDRVPEPVRRTGRLSVSTINVLVAIVDKGGKIAILGVALLFVLPSAYDALVRLFVPKSYYLVGALTEAPDYERLVGWNVDLAAVDTAGQPERLERLIASRRSTLRLRGKEAYIPGRSDPALGAAAPEGRQWEGDTCLFANEVTFVTVSRVGIIQKGKSPYQHYSPFPFHDAGTPRLNLAKISGSELLRLSTDHTPASAAAYLMQRLRDAGLPKACTLTGSGTLCPHIQIWFRGAPAACNAGPPRI